MIECVVCLLQVLWRIAWGYPQFALRFVLRSSVQEELCLELRLVELDTSLTIPRESRLDFDRSRVFESLHHVALNGVFDELLFDLVPIPIFGEVKQHFSLESVPNLIMEVAVKHVKSSDAKCFHTLVFQVVSVEVVEHAI